jgi:hypothetical protein
MTLMLPLILLFMCVGLTARALDRRVYVLMYTGIVMVSLYYFLAWLY